MIAANARESSQVHRTPRRELGRLESPDLLGRHWNTLSRTGVLSVPEAPQPSPIS